jgi:adenosylhomocysteine nucleosidase
VDMESGAVAAVAAAHGLAFAVLRAICDPAARDLPPAALAALDAGGAIMALRVGASVLRDPAQIPALFKLAADAARARAALRKYVLGVGDIGAVPVSVEDR